MRSSSTDLVWEGNFGTLNTAFGQESWILIHTDQRGSSDGLAGWVVRKCGANLRMWEDTVTLHLFDCVPAKY